MVDVTKSACINHQTIEAVARCKQCNVPICGMCVEKGPSGYFCSPSCRDQYAQFVQRANDMQKRGWATGFTTQLRRFAIKAAIYAALFAAFVFAVIKFEIPFLIDIVNEARNWLNM